MLIPWTSKRKKAYSTSRQYIVDENVSLSPCEDERESERERERCQSDGAKENKWEDGVISLKYQRK